MVAGDAALVRVAGTIDEHFPGFGDLAGASAVVIDVSAVEFMTSFGVARWIKSMAALPPSMYERYLAGCPPIFVEQLNMILNFDGGAKILSVKIPYTCNKCGAEIDELVDVVAAGPQLAEGNLPEKRCPRCSVGKLAVDLMVSSYLGCLRDFGATAVSPRVAQLLATNPTSMREQVVKVEKRPRAPTALDPRLAATLPPAPRSRHPVVTALVFVVIVAAIAASAYFVVGPT